MRRALTPLVMRRSGTDVFAAGDNKTIQPKLRAGRVPAFLRE